MPRNDILHIERTAWPDLFDLIRVRGEVLITDDVDPARAVRFTRHLGAERVVRDEDWGGSQLYNVSDVTRFQDCFFLATALRA